MVDIHTLRWKDGVLHHDWSDFPNIELVRRKGTPLPAYKNRPETLNDLFLQAVDEVPDSEAVVFPEFNTKYTYKELDNRVGQVASGLVSKGIQTEDRIGMLLSNRPEFVVTFLACARIGATIAPINTRVSSRELSYLLSDLNPEIIITEEDHLDMIDAVEMNSLPQAYIVGDDEKENSYNELVDKSRSVSDRGLDQDTTVCILYTSGTTGQPKGCLVDNFHIVNATINHQVSSDTWGGLRTLAIIPLFHVGGLVSNFLHAVWNQGTAVILDEFDPETFLWTIEDEQIECVLGVPSNYVLAIEKGNPEKFDLSSLKIAAYGGAPMSEQTIEDLQDALPDVRLCNAYGTTEAVGGRVTLCPDEYSLSHSHTIGLPTPPIEITVVDENRVPLGPGTVGELAIRGPFITQEYVNKPEETKETFKDGWFYTGDLAEIHECGFVELKGRENDKIVRGGENIYARDIEEVLKGHEKVLEASATGFPDEVLGERVLAAVVPKPSCRLTEEMLLEYCQNHLADYKIPEIVRIVDEFPRNTGGKVLKQELVPDALQHGIRAGTQD